MARAAAQGFSWKQFKVMLRVVIKGEQHLDSTGMGMGDDGTERRHGFWGSLGAGARKVAMGFLFLLLAAVFFMMGCMLGEVGITPYQAFSLCVVSLVGLTALTGLYQAVNILYFVRDLGYYLTLPISATTIMWAKLAHFLGMSLLGDLIILPVGLGCLFSVGVAPGAWLTMALAFVLAAGGGGQPRARDRVRAHHALLAPRARQGPLLARLRGTHRCARARHRRGQPVRLPG